MAAKQQNRMLATTLKFIASLIFLYVVFGPLNAMGGMPNVGNASYGLWVPLLYAAAVLGTITTFFSSLMGFFMASETPKMVMKILVATPFAILAWAAIAGGAGWSMNLWLTLIGFVIGWFGMGAEMMK